MRKITVVVPVYNVDKYLAVCLESLLKQTCAPAKIILVDDGSTDTSGEICDQYAKEYDDIVVIHKQNAGLGMARNTGLEYVESDFVAFVDSDDFCDLDYIETFMKVLEETNCDTCKISHRHVDVNGKNIGEVKISPGNFVGDEVKNEIIPRHIGSAPDKKDSIPPSAWGIIYSMAIINEHQLRFASERECLSEDVIFNIHYYFYAKHVVLSDYVGYNYRYTDNSLTTKYNSGRFEKGFVLYDMEKEILTDKGLYEKCKDRLIRQYLINLKMCFKRLDGKLSGFSTKRILSEMTQMCEDKRVQEKIATYPVHLLGAPQRIFVKSVKFKRIWILYISLIVFKI